MLVERFSSRGMDAGTKNEVLAMSANVGNECHLIGSLQFERHILLSLTSLKWMLGWVLEVGTGVS